MSNILIKHQCYRDEQSNEATRDCLLQLGQPHEMILINISPFQTPPLRQPTSDNQSSTLNRIWRTTKDRGRIIWRIIPNPARIKISGSLEGHVRMLGRKEVTHQESDAPIFASMRGSALIAGMREFGLCRSEAWSGRMETNYRSFFRSTCDNNAMRRAQPGDMCFLLCMFSLGLLQLISPKST